MNKRFLTRRLLKLGLIASTLYMGLERVQALDAQQQDRDELDHPFPQYHASIKLRNQELDEFKDWHIDTAKHAVQEADGSQGYQLSTLNQSGILFPISNDAEEVPQHHQERDAALRISDTKSDDQAWTSEIDDPKLLFYPGAIPNNFFHEEQVKQEKREDRESAKLAPKIPEPKPAEEVAQAAPAPAPTPPPALAPAAAPEAQNPENAPLEQAIPTPAGAETPAAKPVEAAGKTILINFNNVSIIEFIRFISRISNKNFVFDENDLQFNVTIISEEPTTIENIMAALLQELRIHDLNLLEQGNNLVIHKNNKVNNISRVLAEDSPPSNPYETELITQVYHLNVLDPERAAEILRPLVSDRAIVEVLRSPNTLIVTDLVANVHEISQLLKNLDAPKSGMVIGQYVVRNSFIDNLIQLAQKIMQPIAHDQPLTFVPHAGANSIFVIATPYLVERTISILQYLDQFQGTTRIINPKDLRFENPPTPEGGVAPGAPPAAPAAPGAPAVPPGAPGQWVRDANGNWQFQPTAQAPGAPTNQPPQGRWLVNENGNWYFQPGAATPTAGGLQGPGGQPEGQWVLNPQGIWVFQLTPGKNISPERLTRAARAAQELPTGHIERTQFYIHKLRFRKGDQIEKALGRIATSLEKSGTSNNDLLGTIYSAQWLEASNSIVFSGTPASIEKIKELINEIDVPLRQVFLEMLILTTTLADSLNYSVNFGSRFGGGQGGGLVAGSQGFLTGASTIPLGLDSADMQSIAQGAITVTPETGFLNSTNIGTATASQMVRLANGYSLGLIGQALHHDGQTFTSIGALINAEHNKTKTDIIMNPKILAEDNTTAEIFVGQSIQFPTQAIANNFGSVITQNYQYQDVGARLKVTPLISSNDVITLEIEQEVSSVATPASTIGSTSQVIGPTTNKNKTTAKIHVPNKYFVILSGMLQDNIQRTRINVPCLGGVPLLGAAFSSKASADTKNNLMVFIRPEIIDSEAEIDDLTKRNQNIWRIRARVKQDWVIEDQETLDWMNLKNTDWNDENSSCE